MAIRKNPKIREWFSLKKEVQSKARFAIGQNAPPQSFPNARSISGSNNAKTNHAVNSNANLRLDGRSILITSIKRQVVVQFWIVLSILGLANPG